MIFPFIEEHVCWGFPIRLLCTNFRDWDWSSMQRLVAQFGQEKAEIFKRDFMADFRDRIPRGGLMFDGGANNGYMSTLFAKQVGPNGRVVAVEAHPGNCTNIHLHAMLNDLSNIEVVHRAIMDRSGDSIHFRGEAVSDNTEADNHYCDSITLDELADSAGMPDAIKLDIEGCELFALQGAKKILAARKAVWAIEVHDWPAENAASLLRFGHTAQQVFDVMKDAGYAASVDEHRIIEPVPASILFCPE